MIGCPKQDYSVINKPEVKLTCMPYWSTSTAFWVSDPTLLILSNVTITLTDSARDLGVIFDPSLTFSEHILSVSEPCLSIHLWPSSNPEHSWLFQCSYHRHASHSQVEYCDSLFCNLPRCQLDRHQFILNSAVRTVTKPRISAISHPSSNLYTSSKLINTSSTKFSLSDLQNTSISKTFQSLQPSQPPS